MVLSFSTFTALALLSSTFTGIASAVEPLRQKGLVAAVQSPMTEDGIEINYTVVPMQVSEKMYGRISFFPNLPSVLILAYSVLHDTMIPGQVSAVYRCAPRLHRGYNRGVPIPNHGRAVRAGGDVGEGHQGR